MTVSYSAPNFSIRDGSHTLADLVTAKGGAIATTDVIFIWTDTTKGILVIGGSETCHASVKAGKTVGDVDSVGELKISGTGKFQVYVSGNFLINPGYGILTTTGSSRGSEAVIDGNECTNDIVIGGAQECSYLDIENILSGGDLDIEDIYGEWNFVTISGKSGAAYNLKGLPETAFSPKGMDLGRANAGLFTEAGEPDINLNGNSALLKTTKNQSARLNEIGVLTRKSTRVFSGYIGSKRVRLFVRLGSSENENIHRDLEYIHSQELQVLAVIRAHGTSGDYPLDMLFRARIVNPLMPDPTGIDFRDMIIDIVGDE